MNQEDMLVLLLVFVLGFVVSQMMSGRLVESSFDIEKVLDGVKGHAKSFRDDFKAGADPVVKWTAPKIDEVNPFTPNPDVEGKKACKSSIDCLDVCVKGFDIS